MFTRFPLLVWLATIAGLILIVVVDLVVIARRNRTVTARDALVWIGVYVSLAALFAGGLWVFDPGPAAGQFVASYITEYMLSVDNLFVLVLIMARFAVPRIAQDKALYVGIVGSMVMRSVFILVGATVLALTEWAFYAFGGLLIYTAVRVATTNGEPAELKESAIIRGLARVVPTTPDYVGSRVFVGTLRRFRATPLLIVIGSISVANVVFAFDSLPAVFGLTQDAYLMITACAFALMGLRQLFFLIGDLLDGLTYLNIGLAVILAFIGVRLIFEAMRDSHMSRIGTLGVPDIGIGASLMFIVAVLAVTAGASFLVPWLKRRRESR